MAKPHSHAMLKALKLIEFEGLSASRAAIKCGLTPGAVYKSQLYKELRERFKSR